MEKDKWYECFMDALRSRVPNKSLLVKELMNLLHIEREAAYRRLRNNVTLSLHEIVEIASKWDISLDSIINKESGKIPFLMYPVNYLAPSEQELKFLQHVIQSINYFKDFPDTEFMDVCNKLPRQLLAGYRYLNQFHIFKWAYQYGYEKKNIPFSQISISPDQLQLTADYYRAIKNVPQTNFIFDHMIFNHLVYEIQHFHSIQLITDEEKNLIKKDLHNLLDYLFDVATNASYPETKNTVNLYISKFNVETNYSYTYTRQISICFVHVFNKHEIYSYEPKMVENFINWMQQKKRTSFQISGVDEKSKIEFFQKQHQLVETL
jgi:hypothetical protein